MRKTDTVESPAMAIQDEYICFLILKGLLLKTWNILKVFGFIFFESQSKINSEINNCYIFHNAT